MLAANRAVAEHLIENEIPGLFRIHEEPDPEALEKFAEFAREFGINMRPPYDRLKLAKTPSSAQRWTPRTPLIRHC